MISFRGEQLAALSRLYSPLNHAVACIYTARLWIQEGPTFGIIRNPKLVVWQHTFELLVRELTCAIKCRVQTKLKDIFQQFLLYNLKKTVRYQFIVSKFGHLGQNIPWNSNVVWFGPGHPNIYRTTRACRNAQMRMTQFEASLWPRRESFVANGRKQTWEKIMSSIWIRYPNIVKLRSRAFRQPRAIRYSG